MTPKLERPNVVPIGSPTGSSLECEILYATLYLARQRYHTLWTSRFTTVVLLLVAVPTNPVFHG